MNVSTLTKITSLAFGFAVALSSSHAAPTSPALERLADKAAALPVTTSIEKKKAEGDGGHFVVSVTNTSKQALKVTAAVVESVTTHAHPKNRTLPEHSIAAGAVWKVEGLSLDDKVTLTAAGFEPLVVTVK